MPAAKEATSYMGVNKQSNHWTGSILRSSSYDLIDRHWVLRKYLVVFKVSFCDEVVTPGVTANSALTSAGCQRHTSSIWPWSDAPKVRLYDTFLGGLHQNNEEYMENALRVLHILFNKTDHNSYFTKLNFGSKEKFKSMHNYTLHLVVSMCWSNYNNSSLHKKKELQKGIGTNTESIEGLHH